MGACGASVHRRSAASATDKASSESGITDFLDNHPECGVCCLVQATSPLTESLHVREAFRMFQEKRADSLVTVVRQHRFLWKVGADGLAAPKNYDPVKRPRRQEWDGELMENGAFYFFQVGMYRKTGSRLGGTIVAYEMPEETFTELDSLVDWTILEKITENRMEKTNTNTAPPAPRERSKQQTAN